MLLSRHFQCISYLQLRKGFSPSGAKLALEAFKETMDVVRGVSEGYDGGNYEGETDGHKGETVGGGATATFTNSTKTYTVQLPISPREWAKLEAPFPMTESKWKQMLAVLNAMKPALVADSGTDDEAPE